MENLIKFKSLGVEMEGDLVSQEGNVSYIKTPFRGEVYAVDQSDLVSSFESGERHTTICTSSMIKVEDWTQGISGETLIQWEFHSDVNAETGAVSSYVKIPTQRLMIEWIDSDNEDSDIRFDSWIEIGRMYEDDDISLNNKTTKNIKPSKLILDIGGSIKVEF